MGRRCAWIGTQRRCAIRESTHRNATTWNNQSRNMRCLPNGARIITLLNHYKHRGVPIKLSSPQWYHPGLCMAWEWGAHKRCHNHLESLSDEFRDMIQKGQWVVLPASMALKPDEPRLSPQLLQLQGVQYTHLARRVEMKRYARLPAWRPSPTPASRLP